MAHMNAFFFQTLSSDPKPPPEEFSRQIVQNFSSFETLKEHMINSADTMFGPGFVWLVAIKNSNQNQRLESRAAWASQDKQREAHLAIVNTYLAGSPYAKAHWRKQSVDMNTTDHGIIPGENPAMLASRGGAGSYGLTSSRTPQSTPGFFKNSATELHPGAADVEPLLCVNTWQHVWVPEYGIGGKRKYLENWWNAINWNTVAENWSRTARAARQA
jgi:superoxide dismutase, Fe-Mn family